MGDSYMSGEGGRWADNGSGGNENTQTWGLGWAVGTAQAVYGDDGGKEAIPGCHRTKSAPMVVGGGYKSLNLACSGAITSSVLTSQWWKPGIDFANDNKGHKGQALMLQEFAATHRVEVVDLSIGGNDMGFADIIAACVQAYVVPLFGGHCSDDLAVTNLINSDAKKALITKIGGALDNIVAAMDHNQYPRGSYRIVYQAPPNIIPMPKDAKYSGFGYIRENRCGLPISDPDLAWAITKVQPTLKDAIVTASSKFSDIPITVLNNDSIFNGHLLCQKGTSRGADGMGTPDWGKTGKTTEWVRRISVSEAKLSPRKAPYRSEPMHPMYWGQRALATCTLAAINSPLTTKMITCATPTIAPAAVFPTCKALNKVYSHGVARKSAASFVTIGAHPVKVKFTRSTRLFEANRLLDKNRDGVVCPKA